MGNRPSAGLYSDRSSRARVTLCTSVGPSARPMWNDSITYRGERHLVGDAERAVDLQRPRGDVVEHLAASPPSPRRCPCGPACSPCTCRCATPCAAPAAGTAPSRSTSRRSSPAPAASCPASRPAWCGTRARSHIMSNARCTRPTVRMAWWMRPPPRRVWATTKAPPAAAEQVVRRHAHVRRSGCRRACPRRAARSRGRRCGRSRRPACRSAR